MAARSWRDGEEGGGARQEGGVLVFVFVFGL